MSSCPLASPDRPAIEAVLFDLDDTLYRIEAIPERVRENIEAFMINRLKIDPEVVPELCQHCYVNYGTTLAGLVLTPHAPHHEKHNNPPQKQQQEKGATAPAVASNGNGNGADADGGTTGNGDRDPAAALVAAASAELAAARAEDARVEREMHAFYREWHDAVHASMPYERLFPPRRHPHNLALKALLDSLPPTVARLVFTNADDAHAARCLELMGLDPRAGGDDFDEVVTFESIMRDAALLGLVRRARPVVCKPADVAFRLALRAASRAAAKRRRRRRNGNGNGKARETEQEEDDEEEEEEDEEERGGVSSDPPLLDPASVAFFDDSTRNVAGAAAAGIFSVLIGRTGLSEKEAPGAAAQLASVLDLPEALPSLWTRHGAEPPAALLRGGSLRTEEEAEADELQARREAAASGGGGAGKKETAEQVRNALSSFRRRRRRSDESGGAKESKSPVLAPA